MRITFLEVWIILKFYFAVLFENSLFEVAILSLREHCSEGLCKVSTMPGQKQIQADLMTEEHPYVLERFLIQTSVLITLSHRRRDKLCTENTP